MSKVALIQLCSSTQVDDNLQKVQVLVEEAARSGAKLIVLPEMFARILPAQGKLRESIKEPFGSGKIQDFLSGLSKDNHVWIVGGTLSLEGNTPDKERAAVLVFDDQGVCVARYDKMHLFDVQLSENEFYRESDVMEPGEHIVTVRTPVGVIGLAVCYDIRFPELFRALVNQGAQLLVIPAAFTATTGKAHWEILLRARAIENFCYVLGAAQGGTHASLRETFGHSMVVAPWGDIVAERLDNTPGIVYADVDLDKVARARSAIPALSHQHRSLGYKNTAMSE